MTDQQLQLHINTLRDSALSGRGNADDKKSVDASFALLAGFLSTQRQMLEQLVRQTELLDAIDSRLITVENELQFLRQEVRANG